MLGEQLSFIPEIHEIDEKAVQKEVIKELRKYRALKVKFENKQEQKEKGIILFKSFVSTKNGNLDSFDELRFQQIQRSLEISLNAVERKIIEMKYLSSFEMTDIQIYLELGIKKDKYYSIKKEAIFTLATALGMI